MHCYTTSRKQVFSLLHRNTKKNRETTYPFCLRLKLQWCLRVKHSFEVVVALTLSIEQREPQHVENTTGLMYLAEPVSLPKKYRSLVLNG